MAHTLSEIDLVSVLEPYADIIEASSGSVSAVPLEIWVAVVRF